MKVVKRSTTSEQSLWDFLRQRLPSTLAATVTGGDYSSWCYIRYNGQEYQKKWWRCDTRRIIAEVDGRKVSLKSPEYYSDFETMLLEYEQQSGKETTLEYWES